MKRITLLSTNRQVVMTRTVDSLPLHKPTQAILYLNKLYVRDPHPWPDTVYYVETDLMRLVP